MNTTHKFKDEWILRALKMLPALKPQIIEQLRQQKAPYLSQGLLQNNVPKSALLEAIKSTFHLEVVDPSPSEIEQAALTLVPEKVCRRYDLLPISTKGETICIAMQNPLDVNAIADLQALSGRTVVPFYCLPEKLEGLFGALFESEAEVYRLIENMDTADTVQVLQDAKSTGDDSIPGSLQAPVIKLVNSIIVKAVKSRASDIHIEHDATSSQVRYRVDGVLGTVLVIPPKLASGAVIARIKIMADLDISVHNRPQDGRAKLLIGGDEIGLRISTLPTNFGEKAVIRILDKKAAEVPFEHLGFSRDVVTALEGLLKREQGALLVTGPTGSGKTTTLYAMLSKLKTPDVNIVTIEDPIEYKLDWINQVQINERQGLTFPTVLRSVLRQDPDIIMVGEIRDKETADVAFQAAMTGHLVFTTLHTNDTVSTVSRLIDMGVEPFKIAPGLIGITAQRLVRRLCSCKKQLADLPAALKSLFAKHKLPAVAYMPDGCASCSNQGFTGRLSLIELFQANKEVKDAIRTGTDEGKLREIGLNTGALHTLTFDALRHVSQGNTSYEEVAGFIDTTNEKSGDGAAQPESMDSNASVQRILVTDDDERIRMLMRSLLEVQGYEVFECENGVQAIQAVGKDRPDLLILDYMMPEMSGKDVITTLKGDPEMASLPIIMLTARDQDEDQEEIIRLGADDFISKPIKPALLLARVNALFRRLKYRG